MRALRVLLRKEFLQIFRNKGMLPIIFVAPVMQFLSGWLVLGEPMPLERWIGFGLVWLALIILTVDSVLYARRVRAAR